MTHRRRSPCCIDEAERFIETYYGGKPECLDLDVLAKALEWGRDFTLAKPTPAEIAAEYRRLKRGEPDYAGQ